MDSAVGTPIEPLRVTALTGTVHTNGILADGDLKAAFLHVNKDLQDPILLSVSSCVRVVKHGRDFTYNNKSIVQGLEDRHFYMLEKVYQVCEAYVVCCHQLELIGSFNNRFKRFKKCAGCSYLSLDQISRSLIYYRDQQSQFVVLNDNVVSYD